MIAVIIAGLMMGAIGSLHCVGMCGPIALSLPVVHNNSFSRFVGSLLYNAGRVIIYSCFGVLFGYIGKTFIISGYQQMLSIVLGIMILISIVVPKMKVQIFPEFLKTVRTKIVFHFNNRSYKSLFFIGVLNGLLPCGLLYIAIAGAVATGNPLNSALFMAAFGLGTLPLMWTIAFFGSELKFSFRLKIKRAYPYLLSIMAALLILRGLGLGIPYLSPEFKSPSAAIDCHD